MKKILVPTDFSPTAEKAFRFAANLALKNDGMVVLYHVYTPVESTFVDTPEKRRMYNLQMERNALKRLQRLKTKVAGPSCPIPVDAVVGRSPLKDDILGFAEQNAIDLIVMGTQGASGLKKVVVGSEASRIAKESTIPVLLIPEKFVWKEPVEIVFATNYAPAEMNALTLSIALANVYKAGITVVRLFAPDTTEASRDNEIAAFENFAKQLQKSFSHFPLRFKSIQTNSVKAAMENLHQEVPYDMLVMVRRNRNFLQRLFLKSFTKAMCYVTHYPLLVVPADYIPGKEQITYSTIGHEHLHHSIRANLPR